jgi:hypothetical protein
MTDSLSSPSSALSSSITSGLGALGKVIQGIGASTAGSQSQKILDQEATQTQQAGVQQELQLRASARQAIGEQVAGQFSNGFLGGTGSALDLLHQSQVNAALDVMNLRQQYTSKAQALQFQGEQAEAAGRSQLIGSLFSAAGGLISKKEDWATSRMGLLPATPASTTPGITVSPYSFNPANADNPTPWITP